MATRSVQAFLLDSAYSSREREHWGPLIEVTHRASHYKRISARAVVSGGKSPPDGVLLAAVYYWSRHLFGGLISDFGVDERGRLVFGVEVYTD